MRSIVDCPQKPTRPYRANARYAGTEPMIEAGDFESCASVRNSLNRVSAEETGSEKT